MSAPRNHTEFFVTGGTLRADAPSYVERRADRELLAGLQAGEFCYVLTSRQMGKSSLMVRTAQKLRAQGSCVLVLDLTGIGQNLTPEQWYDGLLAQAGRQVGQEGALEALWDSHARLGPCQRFFATLREFARARHAAAAAESLPPDDRRFVIFVDEIDAVRSLPFSTDELFAAIRECYNRRSEDPSVRCLTFCLLGVAAPTDLIRDTRTTPFNIGRRIELTDFTADEALPLARGLRSRDGADDPTTQAGTELILRRIIHWTGGHPYLTQRFCRAVAQANANGQDSLPAVEGTKEVDLLCEELFLSRAAQERDDNLLFVRDRLLRGEVDLATLLDLFLKVLHGRIVGGAGIDPLINVLRLSGVIRSSGGRLTVRNRIYAQVFNAAWLRQNLPDAEVRRQREAYRRGVWRTATLATVVVGLVAGLGLAAAWTARVSQERLVQLYNSTGAHRLEQGDILGALPWYAQTLHSTPEGSEAAKVARLRIGALLAQAPRLIQFWTHEGPVTEAVFDPTGRLLASGGAEGNVQVWDLTESRRLCLLKHPGAIRTVEFSPDGRGLLTHDGNGVVRLWDITQGAEVWTIPGIDALVCDRGGKSVLLAGQDGRLHEHALATGKELWTAENPLTTATGHLGKVVATADGASVAVVLDKRSVWLLDRGTRTWRQIGPVQPRTILDLAFSPDGRHLATGGEDSAVRLWTLADPLAEPFVMKHGSWVHRVRFNPAGNLLLSCSSDMTARLWHASTGESACSPMRHQHAVRFADFSPDGEYVVTAGFDGKARVWRVSDGEPAMSPISHQGNVTKAVFDPASRRLVTVGADRTVRLWEMAQAPPYVRLVGHPSVAGRATNTINHLEFSTDGGRLLSCDAAGNAIVWDAASGKQICRLQHQAGINLAIFSPNGRWVATCSSDRTAALWDAASGAPALPAALTHNSEVHSVAFTPRGDRLASAEDDGTITIWDTADGRKLMTMAMADRAAAWGLEFHPSGQNLVCLLAGKSTVAYWDTRSGRLVAALAHEMEVVDATFSTDGTMLVVSECDNSFNPGSAVLWRLADLRQPLTKLSHSDGVTMSRFSPSGELIATGSEDGTARIWNARDGTPRSAPILFGYQVRTVAFSADSGLLLVRSGSNRLRLLDARAGEPVTAPLYVPVSEGASECAALSPDGHRVAVGMNGGGVGTWTLPNAGEPVDRLVEILELQSGYRIQARTILLPLSAEELLHLWQTHGARAVGVGLRP